MPVDSGAKATVTFDDSITDGTGSTENANRRLPDDLAVRLNGKLTHEERCRSQHRDQRQLPAASLRRPNARARFDRDVPTETGVASVILLESINDIDVLQTPNADHYLTAQDLEQGLSQLATRAHEHGIRVFGATLTHHKGSPSTPKKESRFGRL